MYSLGEFSPDPSSSAGDPKVIFRSGPKDSPNDSRSILNNVVLTWFITSIELIYFSHPHL